MNRMPVQKIKKLDNRLREWRARRQEALLIIVAFTVVFVPLCALAVAWLFTELMNLPTSFADALIVCLVIFLPAFLFFPRAMAGSRPTERDVLEDQELRRAMGMPDEIED